jgi:hypothetical protein
MTQKPRVGMPEIHSQSTSYNRPVNQEIKSIKPDQAVLENCRITKQEILPKLKQLKQILDNANIAYQQALNNWKQLAQEYEKIDYQEKMIIHNQTIITKIKTPLTKKASSTKESSTEQAMKVLANLSLEKLAEILALIKKQQTS